MSYSKWLEIVQNRLRHIVPWQVGNMDVNFKTLYNKSLTPREAAYYSIDKQWKKGKKGKVYEVH